MFNFLNFAKNHNIVAMKKLFVLLIVLAIGLVSFASDLYHPLVEEGRTWWYEAHSAGSDCFKGECGIRIGAEEEFEGVKWHRLEAVKCMEYTKADDAWISYAEPILLAHIREVDKKVSIRLERDTIFASPMGMGQMVVSEFLPRFDDYEPCEMQIYDFNASQNDEFVYGSVDMNFTYKVSEIGSIENCGYDYKTFNAEFIRSTEDRYSYKSDLQYMEIIGQNELAFFLPIRDYIAAENSWTWPVLRYVTDSDGTIIFEGRGGLKLWETDGFENPSISEDVPRWYNLQGLEIATPTSPGIYIKIHNGRSEKVAVK